MKKISVFALTMTLGQLALAQTQLPNSNFEDWATADNGTDSLIGWSSSNAVVMYPVNSLYQETDMYQGNYAAKVSTAPFGFVQYTTIGMLVNGQAEFTYGGGGGGANVQYASGGGTPVSVKPSELRGFYKYVTGSATDQGTAIILLSRYNTTLNKRDTVSYATYIFAPQDPYAAFTIPLPDMMPGVTPDTITTIFSSSNPATVATNGVFSELFLDSITLFTPATPPVANFTADATTGTVNATVIHFTDQSTNTPTAWNWTFTPNTVAYQSGTSATSANPSVKFTATGSYTVKLEASNADGSDDTIRTAYIQINPQVGIDEPALLDRNAFFPNPAKDRIHLDKSFTGAALRITDIYGRTLLYIEKLEKNVVDVSALANGMYYLSIQEKEQTRSGKLLIRK